MRVLELLTARLCHELSTPIAAISNGVEILAEEEPGSASDLGISFSRDAAVLIGESARRANTRLQFHRFAYGFRLGSMIAGPPPHELVAGMFGASRVFCDYPEEVRRLPLDWQKLACNLLAVGAEMLPRGGHLLLSTDPLKLEAIDEAAHLSLETRTALTLILPIGELTSRTVQAFFCGLLARALSARLIATTEPGRVRLAALADSS
jgi:histidine phosphotransferase ChpT